MILEGCARQAPPQTVRKAQEFGCDFGLNQFRKPTDGCVPFRKQLALQDILAYSTNRIRAYRCTALDPVCLFYGFFDTQRVCPTDTPSENFDTRYFRAVGLNTVLLSR